MRLPASTRARSLAPIVADEPARVLLVDDEPAQRLEQQVMDCLENAPGKRSATALELWQKLGEVPS